MGWNLALNHSNERWIAVITLIAITVMNIFGVRIVAIVNNTGVLFEILGMVIFAFIVALFHHHQSAGVIFHTGGTIAHDGDVPRGDVHVALRDLRLRHGVDALGRDEETRGAMRRRR